MYYIFTTLHVFCLLASVVNVVKQYYQNRHCVLVTDRNSCIRCVSTICTRHLSRDSTCCKYGRQVLAYVVINGSILLSLSHVALIRIFSCGIREIEVSIVFVHQ